MRKITQECAGNIKKVATNVTENDIIIKEKFYVGSPWICAEIVNE